MKPPIDHSKPATAALEAMISSPVSAEPRIESLSLRRSFQAANQLDMQDLFDAVRSDNDLAFPSISWDFSSDEEEIQEKPLKPTSFHPMKKPPPTIGFAMHQASVGQCNNKNLRTLARSKTLRTSITNLGGYSTQHRARHV